MSGDMFNNPDALAVPDTHDFQNSDNKTTVSTDDARVLACWGRVNQRMRKDIGDAAWRNWIKPLRISRLKEGTLTLEANSTLARERVSSQYADRLRVISSAELGMCCRLSAMLRFALPPNGEGKSTAPFEEQRIHKKKVPQAYRQMPAMIFGWAGSTLHIC